MYLRREPALEPRDQQERRSGLVAQLLQTRCAQRPCKQGFTLLLIRADAVSVMAQHHVAFRQSPTAGICGNVRLEDRRGQGLHFRQQNGVACTFVRNLAL